MSSDAGLLDDLVRSILTNFRAAERDDDGDAPELWRVFEECGLTSIGIPEGAGGGGGTLRDIAVVLRCVGEFGAPVPIADHLLGQLALHGSGLAVASGRTTVAFGDLDITPAGNRAHVTGRVLRAAHGRHASQLIVIDPRTHQMTCIDIAGATITPGTNLAGEPRDELSFDVDVDRDRTAADVDGDALGRLADVFRSVMITGAARGALELSVRYATERSQFGRKLAAFQAIQHQVAVAAAEVALLDAAVAAALTECERDLAGHQAALAGLACKASAGRAGTQVAAMAHQVHGAIGFAREHELHLLTTRIWSWRHEFHSTERCERELAELAAGRADDLWALLTAS